MITTRLPAHIDSKVLRLNSAGIIYTDYDNDGAVDLYVANGSQENVLSRNKSAGWIRDVTQARRLIARLNSAGSYDLVFVNQTATFSGTTANFIRIGHSLLALLAGFIGGAISRYAAREADPPV